MAQRLADSAAVSVFCDSVALMLSVGIQTDEAVHMLADDMGDTSFGKTCKQIYRSLISGKSLAQSMQDTGVFPRYATDMVAVGERSGHLEDVLRSLSVYYSEESRLFSKIASSIGYPTALLCIMSVILLFAVIVILPVFIGVYERLSGSLTAGSFNEVSIAIGIGWVALVVTLVLAIVFVVAMIMTRFPGGRQSLLKWLEKIPLTRDAMYELALSRFVSALAIYIASGLNTDEAMDASRATVTHDRLKGNVAKTYELMIDSENPRSIVQAISEVELFDAVYVRMLTVASRSGSLDNVLIQLSSLFFNEAISDIDEVIDSVEPIMAAFLTVAVGATLISVMLPLIGVMGSIS
ncbi:type II secretion system F family protein [Anaerotardibacter muris]|uniref:type II secretion system F family protein n=1 Tax=Anaerotardibacter muris TaxID=2941505 RepID=UPI00203D3CFA|nr:type II secretion system F family protein [Anaerotardibacter muris]